MITQKHIDFLTESKIMKYITSFQSGTKYKDWENGDLAIKLNYKYLMETKSDMIYTSNAIYFASLKPNANLLIKLCNDKNYLNIFNINLNCVYNYAIENSFGKIVKKNSGNNFFNNFGKIIEKNVEKDVENKECIFYLKNEHDAIYKKYEDSNIYENFNLFKFVVDNGIFIPSFGGQWFVDNNKLDHVKYLHNINLLKLTSKSLEKACVDGLIEMVAWILENRTEGYDYRTKERVENHLDLCDWDDQEDEFFVGYDKIYSLLSDNNHLYHEND